MAQRAAADGAKKKKESRTDMDSKSEPVSGAMFLKIATGATKRLASLLVVYCLAYFGFSFGWVVLCVVLQCVHTQRQLYRRERRRAVRSVARNEPTHVKALLEDLPSWVFFPSTERAEWLNKTIAQLWPYINGMLESILRETIEPEIKRNMPTSLKGIRFDEVNFGDQAPRIGGVRAFVSSSKRSEIALDFDIVYSGDAKINLLARGVKLGVEDLYVRGTMRVLLGPLFAESPLVQAISMYFVNRPEIDFNLTNLLNVLDAPGANTIIRSIINDTVASFVVLPNKINIPLVENMDCLDMKLTRPQGLLRIHVIEAKNLMAKDIGIGKRSTSDPYVILNCGVETFQTKVKYSTVDPVWREAFDMFVDDAENQSILMKLFDEDRSSRDEPLGEKNIHVQGVCLKKYSRVWLSLDKAKQGQIHIEMTWLDLNPVPEVSPRRAQSSTQSAPFHRNYPRGALLVFVDSASNLPRGRSSNSVCCPIVKVSLGNASRETRRLVNTINPVFEESFRFCVEEPEYQVVKFEVCDHKKNKPIGSFHYRLADLMDCEDMTLSQPFQLTNSTADSTLTVKLIMLGLLVPDDVLAEQEIEITDGPRSVSSDSPLPSRTSAVREGTNGLIKRSSRRSNATPDDFKSLQKVCEIQLSLAYEQHLRKLSLVVHKIKFNDGDGVSLKDVRPYIRIYVLSEHSKCQRVTTASLRNANNPVFNEAFEFDIDEKEKLKNIKLDVLVKSEANLLRRATGFRSVLAGTLIDLGDVDMNGESPQWFQMYGKGKMTENKQSSGDNSPRRETSTEES